MKERVEGGCAVDNGENVERVGSFLYLGEGEPYSPCTTTWCIMYPHRGIERVTFLWIKCDRKFGKEQIAPAAQC